MSEHVDVELDTATARWLHNCADRRGGDVRAAAARQLRTMALIDSGAQHDVALADYLDDAHDEQAAALAEAGIA